MRILLALLLAVIASAPLQAETIAITGGRVIVGDGSPPIEGGTVLIRDGRIAATGGNVAIPATARRIDATGKWITPGIFSSFSRVGLIEIDAVSETNDKSASASGFGAALDIAPAIDPDREAFAVSRAAGVTRALVVPGPGAGIFAGEGAVVDLGADFDAVTRARYVQFAELGERGAAAAGGSRAASILQFRAMLREASDYAAGRGAFDDELLRAEDARALLRVIRGETRLLVHVEKAQDILQMLALRRDYPQIRLILAGVTEGWRVADRIAAAGVPVIASPLANLPERFETRAVTQSNVARMKAAGVTVALGMVDDEDAHQLRYLRQYAGNLVALTRLPDGEGLAWDTAFAAITGDPARALGLEAELGSLKPGRRADVVVWSADPLELSSYPESVIIDGIEQPTATRSDALRERYRNLERGPLPRAYEN